jgi:ribosome-associated heat shock protein Hsp15
MSEGDRQRIDKWLWFARVVKTRTLAQKLVLSGAVRINREKCDSASHALKTGDVLTIAVGRGIRVLKVAAPGARRGPAEEARTLYEDLSPPAPPHDDARPSGGPRPTKRDRRAVDALHDDFPGDGD